MKLFLTYQHSQKLQKLCIFGWRTYLQLDVCHLISFAPMHTRDFYIPAVSTGNHWNTKIPVLVRIKWIFSQFTGKLSFLKKKTTYLQKLYTKHFHTHSFQLYPWFPRMFSLFACSRGFMIFEFSWATTISPRNAPLGSSRWRKMVKAYSVLFFIIDNGSAVVWLLVCCKVIFDENNFFRPLGWVQRLLFNITYWMHILVSLSCTNSFGGVQNQSLFYLFFLVCSSVLCYF